MFKKRDTRKLIGYYRPCDFLTMGNALFGIIGIMLAMTGNSTYAILCIIVSGICDAFDGIVARRGKYDKTQMSYGVELDSLADIISFGISPMVITLCMIGFNHWSTLFVCAFYVMAGLIRLAYYNTLDINGLSEKTSFKGVPITIISIIYPLVYFACYLFGFVYFDVIITLMMLFTGASFIIPVQIKKLNTQGKGILSIVGFLLIIFYVIKSLI